jgi:hypothetical protein
VHILVGQPPFPLDLNQDGKPDFYILDSHSHNDGVHNLAACQHFRTYGGRTFGSSTDSSNAIRAAGSKGQEFEAALRYGAKIQRGDRFITSAWKKLASVCCYSTTSHYTWRGPWANGGKGVKNRYLGFKFKIKGRYHFGWARLTVTTIGHNFAAILTGYAYETIPGKAIIAGATKRPDDVEDPALNQPAPQPATLGAMALGAPGLAIWRRNEPSLDGQ